MFFIHCVKIIKYSKNAIMYVYTTSIISTVDNKKKK